MKLRFRYFWKYWIKPVLTLTDPNSENGIKLRIEKLKEDSK